MVVLGCLPFVYVDVSVRDSGIIRPVIERTEIKAGISELVDSVYVLEGQKVKQGDTLLTFRRSNPDYKIRYQQKRLNDIQAQLADLRFLTNSVHPVTFTSGVRKQEYISYIQQKNEYETHLIKTKKDLERNHLLFEKKVISEEEYEKYQYENTKAGNELRAFEENQISKWQSDLNAYSNLFEEMETDLKQTVKNKDMYVVISPVSGSLDQFRGIYGGSNVQSGNLLAIISPDSTLYAEIYVSPRNIGYIHLGMPVKIKVDAFNYNEWGNISGEVSDISSDFLTTGSEDNICYKVKCRMNKNYLQRKNGARGILKKGMFVSSHFLVARRSLFDLIYQKMDDWINPEQYVNEINMAQK
jgi:multidrug resistance efflux pump